MYIDPAASADASLHKSCINRLRLLRVEQSINHTDYQPLIDLPITVSIETKRGAENWNKALLQMGTWQAAQLRCLTRESGIDFLPGLVIQGHQWHFIVSVRDGTRSVSSLIARHRLLGFKSGARTASRSNGRPLGFANQHYAWHN